MAHDLSGADVPGSRHPIGRRSEDIDKPPGKLAPGHAQLRHRVAVALRTARGEHSQADFCRKLADYIGRPVDESQWSRYERERVDAPGYVVLAASIAGQINVAEMFNQGNPIARVGQMSQQVERLTELTSQLQAIAVRMQDAMGAK